MDKVLAWSNMLFALILLPPLLIAFIRKVKARLQNRRGPCFLQVFYDWSKLYRKGETLSSTLSWVFRTSAGISFCASLMLALWIPWIAPKPSFAGDDLFFIIYLMAFSRFFSLLASLDAGSSFGGFAASREATLALLVEPAFMLSLVALGICAKSSDLSIIFLLSPAPDSSCGLVFLFAALGLLLSSLVELSRMPIDDPTTHLELTMVHEAMILESSGRNLLLVEFSYALKMSVLLGLSAQCLIRAIPGSSSFSDATLLFLSYFVMVLLAVLVALIEGLTVKLRWRKAPEFIAYALTMSLLACFMSIGDGAILK